MQERPSLTGWVQKYLAQRGIPAQVQVIRSESALFLLITLERRNDAGLLTQHESLADQLHDDVARMLDPAIVFQGIFWKLQREGMPEADGFQKKKSELAKKLQDLRLRRTDIGLSPGE